MVQGLLGGASIGKNFLAGMSGSPSFQGGSATSSADTGDIYASQNSPFTIGSSGGASTPSLLTIGAVGLVALWLMKKL